MPLSTDNASQYSTAFGLTANASNITSYSMEVDHSNGLVTVTVDYEEDMTPSDVTFTIHFNILSANNYALQSMTDTQLTSSVKGLKDNGCFG